VSGAPFTPVISISRVPVPDAAASVASPGSGSDLAGGRAGHLLPVREEHSRLASWTVRTALTVLDRSSLNVLLPHEDLSVPCWFPKQSSTRGSMRDWCLRSCGLLFRNGFVGSASESSVKVRWARRFVSNDLAPQFRGQGYTGPQVCDEGPSDRGYGSWCSFFSPWRWDSLGSSPGSWWGRHPGNPRWVSGRVIGLIAFAALLPAWAG
jgi:hypothetical protein